MYLEIGKYGIDFVGLGMELHIDSSTLFVAVAIVVALRLRKVMKDKKRKF